MESPNRSNLRARSRESIADILSTDKIGDKENLTLDVAGLTESSTQVKATVNKNRSKSIGPEDLEVLRKDAGNRQKSPAVPKYKSILKPAIPLSPPKAIPPRKRKSSGSPSHNERGQLQEKAQEGMSTDGLTLQDDSRRRLHISSEHSLALGTIQSFRTRAQDDALQALRTEDEQPAVVKERERQEVLARKDARRKSLANRRVSFAPEATLHTWDVVEMPEDSTTSSASTNATRRASGLTATAISPYPRSDPSEPPSTPPEQVEEVQVAVSPTPQRNLHRKKRRRSSCIPPMNFNNPDEFSSSPCSGDSANSDDTNGTFMTAEEEGSSSDSDDKDLVENETINNLDGEDLTARSDGNSSTGSSSRLEEALRQAAQQAGTQGIEYDENGDITMEMADDHMTAAFRPATDEEPPIVSNLNDSSTFEDQENFNPFSPAFRANAIARNHQDQERTMELTQAVGRILPGNNATVPMQRPLGARSPARRISEGARGQSPSTSSFVGDESMDFTMAFGGIDQKQKLSSLPMTRASPIEEDEVAMDLTTAVGGILEKKQDRPIHASRVSVDEGDEMEMTIAAGGILSNKTERTEPANEDTTGMDFTVALGAILPENYGTSQSRAKASVESESKNHHYPSPINDKDSIKPNNLSVQSTENSAPDHVRTTASETGSPSLIVTEGRDSKRKIWRSKKSEPLAETPNEPISLDKPTAPTKESTSGTAESRTSGKTPPTKNVAMRAGSPENPKKLFATEIKQAAGDPISEPSFSAAAEALPAAMPAITMSNPNVKRNSGLGVDRTGIGSPRVSTLLDRRGSIGERAKPFVASNYLQTGVRFANPQVSHENAEQEQGGEPRRRSGLKVLRQDADEQDLGEDNNATSNLKGLIESLTPQKKRKLNGRKSLHVGAAKGILGKRPAELDEDQDDEGLTPQQLKGMESSPIKKIKLSASTWKAPANESSARSATVILGREGINEPKGMPLQGASPARTSRITTPRGQPRYKDVKTDASSPGVEDLSIPGSGRAIELVAGAAKGEGRVHLQDFLNLTSIRFMDLTTTKRRHTLGQRLCLEGSARKIGTNRAYDPVTEAGSELENCVVAGACTLPLLDLYQHSCRELKKYITEGRGIVRAIEEETFEDNPPLFREYMSAPMATKSIMDNQFKNVKTQARLLSKAMWYEWRMKLLDSLKDGLLKNSQGMDEDAAVLNNQEQLVHAILPDLLNKHGKLEAEARVLQAQADGVADCDQDELKDARSNLIALEEQVAVKQKLFGDLRPHFDRKTQDLMVINEKRQECIKEIEAAEKVGRESQGWTSSEVMALQESIAALEQEHGWTITSAGENSLTMVFKRTLQLYFKPQSFQASRVKQGKEQVPSNCPISLTYVADIPEQHVQPLTTEKRFFLQIMRAQLQCIDQAHVEIRDVLDFVSRSWEKACNIAHASRQLSVHYLTTPTILSDETMAVRSTILLRAMETKVELQFEVFARSGVGVSGLEVVVKPSAKAVYGEELNAKKMSDFLKQRISQGRNGKRNEIGSWASATDELRERLVARGKKP